MRSPLIKKIESVDWEFLKDDTRYLTHDFHRYSSKFIPQIASNLIKIFSEPKETILDVFVGSGTTLVEANLSDRNSIGIDLNPLACLIAEAKTTQIKSENLENFVNNFLKDLQVEVCSLRHKSGKKQLSKTHGLPKKAASDKIPKFPNIERWFQPQVLEELSLIKEQINTVKDKKRKKLLVCAFSAILRTVSNAHSSYGNLMINKNKPEMNKTFEIFEKRLLAMSAAIKKYNSLKKNVKSKIICTNSEDLSFIPTNSIDLIVTHPPYVSAVPYAEYQKLSLNWLGSCFPDIVDNKSIELLNPRALDKRITGGGRSRNDVLERYMKSMKHIFSEMGRVLKRNDFCCVVIGHPTIKGKVAELKDEFLPLAQDANLELFYTVARGSHRTTMGKMKGEYILIFQKT